MSLSQGIQPCHFEELLVTRNLKISRGVYTERSECVRNDKGALIQLQVVGNALALHFQDIE